MSRKEGYVKIGPVVPCFINHLLVPCVPNYGKSINFKMRRKSRAKWYLILRTPKREYETDTNGTFSLIFLFHRPGYSLRNLSMGEFYAYYIKDIVAFGSSISYFFLQRT